MKRKPNVIIFSAGESVRNGNVAYIEQNLKRRNIMCYDWRELFTGAHDSEYVALLPSLAKKIPTFDFALILAETVDTVKLRGTDVQGAMRDNVIFELGLCIMALGIERVILLSEESVRIPDDLIRVGKVGIEQITFNAENMLNFADKIGDLIERKSTVMEKRFEEQLDKVIEHINVNSEVVSPVFVGAAVSSAEAYFLNFIIRLMENTDKGFSYKNNMNEIYRFPNEFELEIVIPLTANSFCHDEIIRFYKRNKLDEFVIPQAGMRGLFFNGMFDEQNKKLTIVDIPTSITASYSVVKEVLNIDSDDDYDASAEERFVIKEMDMYAYTLKKLLNPKIANERLAFITDISKRKRIIDMLKNVNIRIENISDSGRN